MPDTEGQPEAAAEPTIVSEAHTKIDAVLARIREQVRDSVIATQTESLNHLTTTILPALERLLKEAF